MVLSHALAVGVHEPEIVLGLGMALRRQGPQFAERRRLVASMVGCQSILEVALRRRRIGVEY